jgi:putative transcriptional regulator
MKVWVGWALAGLVAGSATVPRLIAAAPVGKPATGRLLVAHQRLSDPNFSRTVVLLVNYDQDGAMGVVLNRPLDVKLESAFPDIDELQATTYRLYLGGPVSPNRLLMLLRASKPPKSSQLVFGDVYVCGDRDVLRSNARQKGSANRFRVFAGHAGWAPRQLDAEIARGDWYVVDADRATVLETPAEEMWKRLIDRLSGSWAKSNVGARPTGIHRFGAEIHLSTGSDF